MLPEDEALLAYYVVIVYLPDEPGSVEKGEMVHFYEIRVHIREYIFEKKGWFFSVEQIQKGPIQYSRAWKPYDCLWAHLAEE